MFEKIVDGIYRLCVPFCDIYTSVFLLTHKEQNVLVDCASSEDDVKKYIIPALQSMNITPTWLICSHMHTDHCGGLDALKKEYPDSRIGKFAESSGSKESWYIFAEGEILCDRFQLLNLKGHSEDSMGIFDLESRILLSFDSLQLYGVSSWGTGIGDYMGYHETLHRVKILSPKGIIASHNYMPYGYCAFGVEKVERYLTACRTAVGHIMEFVNEHPNFCSEEIAALYNKEYREFPPISSGTVDGLLRDKLIHEDFHIASWFHLSCECLKGLS